METILIRPRDGKWSLYRREWCFQGDRPDYFWLADLTPEEALSMLDSYKAEAYADDYRAIKEAVALRSTTAKMLGNDRDYADAITFG